MANLYADEPIVNQPNLYIDNLQISYATSTTLTIAAGECRDSTNTYDIQVAAPLTLNMAVVGANGIDTGAIAASSLYYIYAIMDIRGFNPPAVLASLSTAPLMPTGYGAFRVIGYQPTTSGSVFTLAYNFGTSNNRVLMFDAPVATPVTAGTSSTYADVVLTNIVPPIKNLPVLVQSLFTSNAAADTLKFQPYGATGDMITIIAPVAGSSAHTSTVSEVMIGLDAGVGQFEYKVSAGTVALNIQGFRYSL